MATHDRKSCMAHLVLVAPPIPNAVASQITKEDEKAINVLRSSHFYMICGRSKARIVSCTPRDMHYLDVTIQLESGETSSGSLVIPYMHFYESAPEDFRLKIKSNGYDIRIICDETLVFATTPDDILMRRGRRNTVVQGFDNYRELTTFDMLYVGIAKENQDSFSRLVERGHKSRNDILALEPQRTPGARVSEETYLLFFMVDPLILTTFGKDAEFDEDDLDFSVPYHRVVADAEKAVINVFQPKYNREKYRSYPKGRDGLYKQGYTGYVYSIAEGFTFKTDFGDFKGARSSEDLLMSNDADFIAVDGEDVKLCISGKDFSIPLDAPEET